MGRVGRSGAEYKVVTLNGHKGGSKVRSVDRHPWSKLRSRHLKSKMYTGKHDSQTAGRVEYLPTENYYVRLVSNIFWISFVSDCWIVGIFSLGVNNNVVSRVK